MDLKLHKCWSFYYFFLILDKNKSIILTFIFDRTDVYDISTFEG